MRTEQCWWANQPIGRSSRDLAGTVAFAGLSELHAGWGVTLHHREE
jgi:hypothetical protein